MDAFLLAPALSLSLDGAPVEEVLLLRGDMASLAWAIERTVESPSGRRLDRHEEFAQKQQDQTTTPAASGGQVTAPTKLVYRLVSLTKTLCTLIRMSFSQANREAQAVRGPA